MVVESKMRLGGRVARRLLSTCSNSSFTVTVLTILLKNLNIGSHVLSKSFAQTPHLERSFREINKYKFMWNESSKYYFINQLSISRVLYSYQGGRPYKHVIVTLDPNKFAEKKQKRLHIYLLHIRPRISLLKHSSLVKVPYLDYDRTVEREERISYPPDTKAFLYYSLSPGKPRYASELHQVMILRLSKVDRTSCEETVCCGRVHFIAFRNIILLCMRNYGKINLFQTTWTKL